MKSFKLDGNWQFVLLGVLLSMAHYLALAYFSLLGNGQAWAIKVTDVLSCPGYQIRQQLRLFGTAGEFVWILNSLLWGIDISLVSARVYMRLRQ